ncbi:patatin-like phospholipase domain-containing protein 2 [Orbicella faveolata]|uniref:patatin-like phospholipase domain-containing protein 2 n=1 Tax=Orbicella faveolata TaxID=48498 RepID=UPI0009E34E6E|nr:patatin-like phospholipase domain-containing protein 2 [Orbicella faveolata]
MAETKDLNLTFSGCGFLGIYHLGVVSCLKENAPALLKRVKCYGGASAGSFAAIALLLDLNVSDSAEFVIRLAKRANSLTLGPLHPSFNVVRTLRRSFERILPDNAHELASGRLHLSLTRVSDLKNVIVSEFFSKEDLVEALIASSYVPFYSGILPAKFRGKYYVDGGISDNLPQHFKEGDTITVSPFSGESDICPNDSSSNDVHIELRNTSMQFTLQNLYRCSRAFFPPQPEVLFDMCRHGYRDTLRFLKQHYPKMLKKGSIKRPSMSQFFPPSWPKSGDGIDGVEILRSSPMSLYSTCSSEEADVFTSSDSDDAETDESTEIEQEGESKLTIILHRTSEAVTEAELWSCYFIRRVFWVLKLAAKPCVISLKQISQLANIILESLPKVEKTGNEYLDELLSMIYMVIHTYQDKHQVQCWKTYGPAITAGLRQEDGSGISSTDESPSSGDNAMYSIPEEVEETGETPACSLMPLNSDDESDIEVLVGQSAECLLQSAMRWEDDVSDNAFFLRTKEAGSDRSINKSVGRWESEGGACGEEPASESLDDYVLLDGYESDVESESSGYDELH